MIRPSKSDSLRNARAAKQDEFYTQFSVISDELRHYRTHLRDKTVLCNCNDPQESNFFKYFSLNFKELGIKKLIAITYLKSPLGGTHGSLFDGAESTHTDEESYAVEVSEIPEQANHEASDVTNAAYLLRHPANKVHALKGDCQYCAGDFRSQECVEFLKESDVVITNPPFSLFREYVAQLVAYDKLFLIIGNINVVTYKEVFNLIKEDRVRLGRSIHSGSREFRVPDHYPLEASGTRLDESGNRYVRVKGVRWFTNMNNAHRNEKLILHKRYRTADYPRYDNFDAIEVGRVADIPADYHSPMGVPITFLDKYNPEQFEILGIDRYTEGNVNPGKRMTVGGKMKYARILIKRKNPYDTGGSGTSLD